ncbi:MAG: peptidase M23 [Desulfobulbus propionicus]|nr:MAG: peptidase M23 [Desulfobulbus propionicus]
MAPKNRHRTYSAKGGSFFRNFFLSLLFMILAGAVVSAVILFETKPPALTIDKDILSVGNKTELPITVRDDQSGIRSVDVHLEQKNATSQLFHRSFKRQSWFTKAGPGTRQDTVVIMIDKARFKDGEAQLVITARDFSLMHMFRGNETRQVIPITIDTRAPKISITHAQRYIRSGGSGIVIYRLSEAAVEHGVTVNDHFFPGFLIEGSNKHFIAYIALPWNSSRPTICQVRALDASGNESKAEFAMNFKKILPKNDRINVSQNFLRKKIPEFEQHYPIIEGKLFDKYLYINKTVRLEDNKAIKKICANPEKMRMWKGRFTRMPGANMAGFADQRTYYFKEKPVDHQTHLGIDLASTARAEVRAANDGKVVFSAYQGIYGNTVIIDHGQGVFSLYAHLSRIDCAAGDLVKKEEVIGRTGTTGMAGGDHLHFSMLVHGIFVTPVEWWDQHWITANIEGFMSTRDMLHN